MPLLGRGDSSRPLETAEYVGETRTDLQFAAAPSAQGDRFDALHASIADVSRHRQGALHALTFSRTREGLRTDTSRSSRTGS